MKKVFALLSIFLSVIILTADFLYAQHMEQEKIDCQPVYGNYGRGQKWGWYGAKRKVKTPVEAREILDRSISKNRNIDIGRIKERPQFFEAEITNKKGERIDLIIIDKRTGRIRSAY